MQEAEGESWCSSRKKYHKVWLNQMERYRTKEEAAIWAEANTPDSERAVCQNYLHCDNPVSKLLLDPRMCMHPAKPWTSEDSKPATEWKNWGRIQYLPCCRKLQEVKSVTNDSCGMVNRTAVELQQPIKHSHVRYIVTIAAYLLQRSAPQNFRVIEKDCNELIHFNVNAYRVSQSTYALDTFWHHVKYVAATDATSKTYAFVNRWVIYGTTVAIINPFRRGWQEKDHQKSLQCLMANLVTNPTSWPASEVATELREPKLFLPIFWESNKNKVDYNVAYHYPRFW